MTAVKSRACCWREVVDWMTAETLGSGPPAAAALDVTSRPACSATGNFSSRFLAPNFDVVGTTACTRTYFDHYPRPSHLCLGVGSTHDTLVGGAGSAVSFALWSCSLQPIRHPCPRCLKIPRTLLLIPKICAFSCVKAGSRCCLNAGANEVGRGEIGHFSEQAI